MEGLCYLVTFEGKILAIGSPNWDAAMEMCNAAHLRADLLLGANIFAYVAGEEVAATYRDWMRALQTGREPQITFEYRCDAPALKREMRMTMTAVVDGGRPSSVLFQSLVLSETERPPINLFDAAHMKRQMESDLALPLVTLCSYCHSVKVRAANGDWVSAEAYYQKGGSDQVRISHGVCPKCFRAFRARPHREP